jgi:hypothetical protein
MLPEMSAALEYWRACNDDMAKWATFEAYKLSDAHDPVITVKVGHRGFDGEKLKELIIRKFYWNGTKVETLDYVHS